VLSEQQAEQLQAYLLSEAHAAYAAQQRDATTPAAAEPVLTEGHL
jgi:hypothetical protein